MSDALNAVFASDAEREHWERLTARLLAATGAASQSLERLRDAAAGLKAHSDMLERAAKFDNDEDGS